MFSLQERSTLLLLLVLHTSPLERDGVGLDWRGGEKVVEEQMEEQEADN